MSADTMMGFVWGCAWSWPEAIRRANGLAHTQGVRYRIYRIYRGPALDYGYAWMYEAVRPR